MMAFLATPRLHIRPFRLDDLVAVSRLLDRCFGPAPAETRKAWLEWTVQNYRALADLHQPPYGDLAVTLASDGMLVGSVGLVPSFGPFAKLPWFRRQTTPSDPTGLFTPEMGLFWAVEPQFRRQGYASEAATALATFAFDTLHAQRLVATTEHSNTASIGVMRKLGMLIEVNPHPDPGWFQTIGILPHRLTRRVG